MQIVAEVSDGFEAIRKAKELQTDLIFMDVGLPMVNGISAARQSRILALESKIIFVHATVAISYRNQLSQSAISLIENCW